MAEIADNGTRQDGALHMCCRVPWPRDDWGQSLSRASPCVRPPSLALLLCTPPPHLPPSLSLLPPAPPLCTLCCLPLCTPLRPRLQAHILRQRLEEEARRIREAERARVTVEQEQLRSLSTKLEHDLHFAEAARHAMGSNANEASRLTRPCSKAKHSPDFRPQPQPRP